jgi:hypothetical protein
MQLCRPNGLQSVTCSFAGPIILFTILLADVLSDFPTAKNRTIRLRKITSRIIVFVQKGTVKVHDTRHTNRGNIATFTPNLGTG